MPVAPIAPARFIVIHKMAPPIPYAAVNSYSIRLV